MIRNVCVLACFAVVIPAAGRSPHSSAADSIDRPNVLIIVADDLGYSDLGCYGSEIRTPHLDRLAANGLRLTRFYNTARCWPTRGALMTGYYAQQVNRDAFPGDPKAGKGTRPAWAPLLAELMQRHGYRTYHSGKWHIDGRPTEVGFDVSEEVANDNNYFQRSIAAPPDQPTYATTRIAQHAIECLRDHQAEHAGEPFFSYVAFTAPHFPLHAPQQDIDKYRGRYDQGWDVIRQQRFEKMRAQLGIDFPVAPLEPAIGPPYRNPKDYEILGDGEVTYELPWDSLTEQQRSFQATKMEIHAAMVDRMDQELGRLLDVIRDCGQWNNTLILFISDNGASAEIMVRGGGHDPLASPGSAESYLCLGPGWSSCSNTPFRRHKTWVGRRRDEDGDFRV